MAGACRPDKPPASCGCNALIEELAEHLSDGESYVDREHVIISLTVDGIVRGERGQGVGTATVDYRQPKDATLIDKNGVDIELIPATPEFGVSYVLEHGSDGWTIQEKRSRSKP